MTPHLYTKYDGKKKQGGAGVLPEKLGEGVKHASWTLTLFQTQICDFPTLFQTWS